MLRIEKESDRHATTPQLIGRIQSANIGDIQAQMDDDRVRIFMELGEVPLVDVEVVRFLSEREDGGIVLVHCPPYVGEWILREQTEGAQPQVPNGVCSSRDTYSARFERSLHPRPRGEISSFGERSPPRI